jgi:hypothetical protein
MLFLGNYDEIKTLLRSGKYRLAVDQSQIEVLRHGHFCDLGGEQRVISSRKQTSHGV